MNRMLVVVFDNESKAFEGLEALQNLDDGGIITRYASTVIAKKSNVISTVDDEDQAGPVGALVGTSIGSLIGLLAGPAGAVIGAAIGSLAGVTADLDNARVSSDFVDDVTKQLKPGTFAVIAEIEEDTTDPLDVRMEALGGKVFRRALSDARQASNAEALAAMKADLDQLKLEHTKAKADRQAKLHEKIDQLEAKVRQLEQQAKDRRDAAQAKAQAKVKMLKAKAAAARSGSSPKATL